MEVPFSLFYASAPSPPLPHSKIQQKNRWTKRFIGFQINFQPAWLLLSVRSSEVRPPDLEKEWHA